MVLPLLVPVVIAARSSGAIGLSEVVQTGELSALTSTNAVTIPDGFSKSLTKSSVIPLFPISRWQIGSVGSRGDSYNTALAESINSLYKTEVIHGGGSWR
ncbi:MAG: hypothetical protein NVSMB52_05660 [Chloroflexota bacterium]